MLLDKFKMQGQVLEIADTWVRNELSTLTAADIPYNDSNVGAELDDINNELSSLDASDVSYNSSNVKSELDEVNEDIVTINTSLTEDVSYTANVPSGSIFARKNNHAINIRCFGVQPLQTLGTLSDYAALGELPQSMRPKTGETWLKYVYINPTTVGQLRIGDDGIIKFGYANTDLTTSDSIYLNETFIN